MRPARVVTLSCLAAAIAGCGARERAAQEATVIPGTDTVVAATPTTTDTADAPRVWTPPPNDCRYTDARPRPARDDPEGWQPYDSVAMAQGVEYRCALRPAGPRVRLVVRGEWGIPRFVDVHAPPRAARPLQRLELDNDQRALNGNDLVVGEDLNGDGWTDLRMQTFSGTGGVWYDVYLYAPARRSFVRDTVLSRTSNVHRLPGPPCVGTSQRMGSYRSGAAYCWKDGRWTLTREVYQEPDENGRLIRTRSELRGDSLQVVRVDTAPFADEDLSP
jgi:hypothetical protein